MLKNNWQETQKNFEAWWRHEGCVIGSWRPIYPAATDPERPSPLPYDPDFKNPLARAKGRLQDLQTQVFPGDTLPLFETDIGAGSLALYLGCHAAIGPDTVWYEPLFETAEDPTLIPALHFDPQNPWWQITERLILEGKHLPHDDALFGIPALCDGLDVLSSLRGGQPLLMDLLEQPDWVVSKLDEIYLVWQECFERLYQMTCAPDGSSSYGAFRLWAPGRVTLLQCDASVMISPVMFEIFGMPYLRDQCTKIPFTMFHVDGTQALVHLDAILSLDGLKAVEWSPQAGIEPPGDPRWYELYKRILASGRSLQVCGVKGHEIIPLFDAIGTKGVYVIAEFETAKEAEMILKKSEPYRK